MGDVARKNVWVKVKKRDGGVLFTDSFINALGGSSGYQWIVNIFDMVESYCPNAILIYNDYNVLTNDTDTVLDLVEQVKNGTSAIDAVGCQAHSLESVSGTAINGILDRIAGMGLRIYISEYDLDISGDNDRLAKMQEQFPVFYDHSAVDGITLWGYVEGETWLPNSHLISSGGDERPVLTWLKENYLKNLSWGY